MNNPVRNIFSLPKGMLLFLAIYTVSFPVFLIEHAAAHTFVLEQWLALSPVRVWNGEVWRMLTYSLVAPGVLGWAVNLFWFGTLVLILARDWSSMRFWLYCMVSAFVGAVPIVLFLPRADVPIFSAGAIIFALLAAWDRLYHRERLIMIGFGEVSVRQAAIFIAVINGVIAFFSCGGWLGLLSMMCGGAAGWLYLWIGAKRVMSRSSRTVQSERVARLEL